MRDSQPKNSFELRPVSPEQIKDDENSPLVTKHERKKWDESNTTSMPVAILNMSKLLLGAAMLSLSWTFSQSSMLPGIISLLFSAVYGFICCLFILQASQLTRVYEYTALLKFTSPICETSAAVVLIYVTLSSCLSYLILIAG